uniref:Uncharacterized protein n=1 Tax=Anguilla anguilla TaxID=7936 RepID=A0A0E9U4N5_ANGAN
MQGCGVQNQIKRKVCFCTQTLWSSLHIYTHRHTLENVEPM